MTQATGANTVTGVFEEAAYKTIPASPDVKKLYLVKNGLAFKQNLMDSNTMTGSRGKAKPFQGNKDTTGALETELGAENSGILLKHLMGSVNTTGTGPYVHTYTIGALPVGLGIETDYGSAISGSGRFIVHSGIRISGGTFTFPQEGAITASYDTVGAGKITEGSATVDATGSLTDTGHTSFSAFDVGVIKEGGTDIAVIKNATIKIENGSDTSAGYMLGSGGERNAVPEGMATVSGSLTAVFDSAALMNKALAGTESSLQLTASRGDGLGSAGNESIDFLVQQLVFEKTVPPIDGPAGITITLNFKGFKTGADLGLQITVKNAVATV